MTVQLAEQLLLVPLDPGSNLVIGNFYSTSLNCVKGTGNGPIKNSLFVLEVGQLVWHQNDTQKSYLLSSISSKVERARDSYSEMISGCVC